MQTAVQCKSESDYEALYPILSSDFVTISCSSAEVFAETLLDIHEERTHIYRGQSRSWWPVLATLFRPEFIAKNAIDTSFGRQLAPAYRGRYYDKYLEWEESIVNGFANACMNEGLALPFIPSIDILDFAPEAASAYFVARNFGIPNRLLDFTKSPIIAAWFAAHDESSLPYDEESESMVVWAIHELTLGQINYQKVSTSWANSQILQMQRQKSVLLVDNSGWEHFTITGKFQPLEYVIEEILQDYLGTQERSSDVTRITLPRKHEGELVEILDNYELSEVNLFPTFDRIARHTLSEVSEVAGISVDLNLFFQKEREKTLRPEEDR